MHQNNQQTGNRGILNNRGSNAENRGGRTNNSRSTPPKHLSKNSFINAIIPHHRDMGLLCLQCVDK